MNASCPYLAGSGVDNDVAANSIVYINRVDAAQLPRASREGIRFRCQGTDGAEIFKALKKTKTKLLYR